MKRHILAGALALALTAVIGAAAAPASAADSFGQHVSSCARSAGFDADHNPGMHQGYAGWSPDHSC